MIFSIIWSSSSTNATTRPLLCENTPLTNESLGQVPHGLISAGAPRPVAGSGARPVVTGGTRAESAQGAVAQLDEQGGHRDDRDPADRDGPGAPAGVVDRVGDDEGDEHPQARRRDRDGPLGATAQSSV